MATANERLRQGIVSHQVGLIRVGNNLRRRVLAHLRRTEGTMRREIADRAQRIASGDDTPVFLTPDVRRRLTRVEQAIRAARNPAFTEILSDMRSELRQIAVGEPEFLTQLIQQISPTEVPLRQPDANELARIVTSRPFQGRLLRQWTQDLAVQERRRIMNEIRIGLTQGQNAREITRRIVGSATLAGGDGVTNLTRAHVQTLVRTAINHIGSAARREFALANARLFRREQWIAVLDSRTSFICLSGNGTIFDVGKGPYPPYHLNCRSIRAPFLDPAEVVRHRIPADQRRRLLRRFAEDNSLGRVSQRRLLTRTQKRDFDAFLNRWVREQVGAQPAVMTTQNFLDGLGEEQLEDVLGVAKSRLFRRGNLSIGRLVDREGSPLRLSDLAKLEARAFARAGLVASDFAD